MPGLLSLGPALGVLHGQHLPGAETFSSQRTKLSLFAHLNVFCMHGCCYSGPPGARGAFFPLALAVNCPSYASASGRTHWLGLGFGEYQLFIMIVSNALLRRSEMVAVYMSSSLCSLAEWLFFTYSFRNERAMQTQSFSFMTFL